MTRLVLVWLALLLAACGQEAQQDLRKWVANSGQGLSARVEALPEVKSYDPFAYDAFAIDDPFKPRKLGEDRKPGNTQGPDLSRRKELLESYPLEQLKFVGTLEQKKTTYALISADGTIHRVKTGNYLGQNFGLITEVVETEIKLKESLQDSEGEWKENEATLHLIEEPQQGKKQ